jgi:sialate O-acetylesterase
MIMPLKGLTIQGALFYQGENNSFGNSWIPFRETFPSVISDWRKIFRDPKLPFGIIQIAGWSTRRSMTYDMNHHTNVIREQQFLTWQNTPNTGLIVSFDANSDSNIHPHRKYPVGDRSARWALSTVYGIKDGTRSENPLEWHGPIYKSMAIKENKILISFEEKGSSGLRLDQTDARGFYIAGKDKVFHHADARVVKPSSVEVWSADVPSTYRRSLCMVQPAFRNPHERQRTSRLPIPNRQLAT